MLKDGDTLSHFSITGKLGQGGIGVVYRAEDTRLRRTVALKLLSSSATTDELQRKRLLQEARATCSLNHPNIVAIYEIGSDGDSDFIAMEYVDGRRLDEVIRDGKMSIATALGYAVQILQALIKAHENGIVHRDLKPQNIMITAEDQVKILDFGLAKFTEPETGGSTVITRTSLTQMGTLVGTAPYMSPEQAEGKAVDARSDLFSFGSILFEMLSGRRCFAGNTPMSVLTSLLKDRTQPLSDLRPEVPADLDRIIGKALEKDRDLRYQSAREILADVRRLQRDIASGSAPPTVKAVPAGPHFNYRLALAVALGLIIGIALFYFVLRPSPALPPSLSLVSTFPGAHRSATFSPDGSMIAFVSEVDDVPQIWIKNLLQGDPVQLTFDASGSSRPRWSPNNDQILFQRGPRTSSSIWTIPPLGGQPRLFIEDGRNPNWFHDGKQLVFERGLEIWIANAQGADQTKVHGVAEPDLLLGERFPAPSPDGSQIVYFESSSAPFGDFWTIQSKGGTPHQLTFDNARGYASAWTQDSKNVIISSQRAGSFNLWKVPFSGGNPVALTTGAGEDMDPDVRRDGSRTIFTNTRNAYLLQLLDLNSGKNQTLLRSHFQIAQPTISPDGRYIAYVASEGSDPQVFTYDMQERKVIRLPQQSGEKNILPQWSSSGAFIYFYQLAPTNSFRKLPLFAGLSTEVLSDWRLSAEYFSKIDPSDKRIAFCKITKGVPTASIIRDIATGKQTYLRTPVISQQWSRDGKWILAVEMRKVEGQNRNISVCEVATGICHTITTGYLPRWSHDETQIYFQRQGRFSDGRELWRMPATDPSKTEKLADLRPMIEIAGFYDVSPDNKIVWVQIDPGNPEIWMLNLR